MIWEGCHLLAGLLLLAKLYDLLVDVSNEKNPMAESDRAIIVASFDACADIGG